MTELAELFIPGFCGFGLHLKLDGFRFIYVCIAVLMWTVSGAFSREYMAHYSNRRRYYVFFWATFAATVGVFLSADLFTLFIFFEIMSFTSYVWVAFDERKESLRAAETYLAVAVIGGMVMLMGLFLLWDLFGTLSMDLLPSAAASVLRGDPSLFQGTVHTADGFASARAQLYIAGGLLLFGFGAKAGMFPLHIWLPKAHPVAPAPASALLSGILTKAGIFGIIAVSCTMFTCEGPWGFLVTVLGLITMFIGALLALFSTNLKRTLACSSVSQIGFILTGIGVAVMLSFLGEGNRLAVRGAFLHMVNHSLIKLVLFLCAGVVFMNLHQLELDDIRGFGRNKKGLLFAFLMGALGISGVPLWNGYVSKTLIHEGIVEYLAALETAAVPGAGLLTSPLFWHGAEWVFLFSGGMTAAYMLKLFVVLFVDRHPVRQAEFDAMASTYMTPLSRFVLVGAAVILPVFGMLPHHTMDVLADMAEPFFMASGAAHPVHYLSAANLKGGIISLAVGVLLYFLFIRPVLTVKNGKTVSYADRWPAWLDLENLVYRPILTSALPAVFGTVFGLLDRYFVQTVVTVFLSVSAVVCRAMDHLADAGVLLARKTTHRQISDHPVYISRNRLAWMAGSIVDEGTMLVDHVSGRTKRYGRRPSSVDKMRKRETMAANFLKMIEESFSFGLMLFGIGLCLTLAYLIFVYFS